MHTETTGLNRARDAIRFQDAVHAGTIGQDCSRPESEDCESLPGLCPSRNPSTTTRSGFADSWWSGAIAATTAYKRNGFSKKNAAARHSDATAPVSDSPAVCCSGLQELRPHRAFQYPRFEFSQGTGYSCSGGTNWLTRPFPQFRLIRLSLSLREVA